jgi:hypothetical protein
MEKIQDENLFDIRISQEGLMNLNRSARITRSLFRLAIVCSVLIFLNILLLQFFYFKKQFINTHSSISILRTIVYPVIGFLDMIVVIWQFYVFKQFGDRCKKAIKESDESLLNQSFEFFYRYARIALLQIFVTIGMYLIVLYFGISLIAQL